MPSESLRADNATLESQFFDALNRVAEPAVRAGFGSPGLTPTGLIVLETTGRRSGLSHRVPVIGTLVGGHVVVGTVRVGRSQWLRNASHDPNVRYWLLGQPHRARAVVIRPNGEMPAIDEPDARAIAALLRGAATMFGWAFVILLRATDERVER